MARTTPARRHTGGRTTDAARRDSRLPATGRRSPESLVVEQAADIREHVSTDELIARVSEMRERISDYQAEYGVESPEELLVDRTNQILSEAATTHDDLHPAEIREWQTTRRNLAFANAALSIANAERFVSDDQRPSASALAQ